jgi:hypothetical protein
MQFKHYFSFASLVVLALFVSQINASAYLFVVHGVSNYEGNTNVNVNINGTRAISNFAYTSTAGYLAVPAGEANITINLVSNGAAIISETATLVDGTYYTVVAVGSLNDSTTYPFRLLVVQVDREVSSDSKAKVAVFHAAAGAPNVDLYAGDSSLASGLAYPSGVVVRAIIRLCSERAHGRAAKLTPRLSSLVSRTHTAL